MCPLKGLCYTEMCCAFAAKYLQAAPFHHAIPANAGSTETTGSGITGQIGASIADKMTGTGTGGNLQGMVETGMRKETGTMHQEWVKTGMQPKPQEGALKGVAKGKACMMSEMIRMWKGQKSTKKRSTSLTGR